MHLGLDFKVVRKVASLEVFERRSEDKRLELVIVEQSILFKIHRIAQSL